MNILFWLIGAVALLNNFVDGSRAPPTAVPTENPTISPTCAPSEIPTFDPTLQPKNGGPNKVPSWAPTLFQTPPPTVAPYFQPTADPTTASPTQKPNNKPIPPSVLPTENPTYSPTLFPTVSPTNIPSFQLTEVPTDKPNNKPIPPPSPDPTKSPTINPTFSPTFSPTVPPTISPTPLPTFQQTQTPTPNPSFIPTIPPSQIPTITPTHNPTYQPTEEPTKQPSLTPTIKPSRTPTSVPSSVPSGEPTSVPSSVPSGEPTSVPSSYPTSFSEVSISDFSVKVVIVGDDTVGYCGDLHLDLSLSVGCFASGWKSINWNVSRNGEFEVGISSYLNDLWKTTSFETVTIPRSFFEEGQYRFVVSMQNFYGYRGVGEKLVTVKNEAVRLTTWIVSPRVVVLFPYSEFQADSMVRVSSCSQIVRTQRISSYWFVIRNSDEKVIISSDMNRLVLGAYHLSANQTYTILFKVSAIFNSTVYEASDSISLVVKSGDIVASISGGRVRTTPVGIDLDISASPSFDQNGQESSLFYSWSCWNFNTSSSCDALLSYSNSIVVQMNGSLLVESTEYRVSVTVSSSDGRNDTASVRVIAIPNSSPIVTISTTASKFNVGSKLSLVGMISSSSSILTRWDAVVDGVTVPISSSSPSSQTFPSSLMSSPQRFPISIYTSGYSNFASVVFRLSAISAASGSVGYSYVTLIPNSPPVGGRFDFSPQSGTASQTIFSLQALGFYDAVEDYPLKYSFSFQQVGKEESSLLLQWKGLSSYISSKLPSGLTGFNHSILLFTTVFDILSASSSKSRSVTVTSPSGISFNSWSTSIKGLEYELKSETILQTINIIATQLNDANCSSSSAEFCESRNRYPCSSTPHSCGSCLPGYKGIVGDSNSLCRIQLNSSYSRYLTNDICTADNDCMFGLCIDGACQESSKTCGSTVVGKTCSGHGSCIHRSVHYLPVDNCLITDTSCSASCECTDGYGGQYCQYDWIQWEEISTIRNDMCKSLISMIRSNNMTSSFLETIISSAFAAFHPYDNVLSNGTFSHCNLLLVDILDVFDSDVVTDIDTQIVQNMVHLLSQFITASKISSSAKNFDVINQRYFKKFLSGLLRYQDDMGSPSSYVAPNVRALISKEYVGDIANTTFWTPISEEMASYGISASDGLEVTANMASKLNRGDNFVNMVIASSPVVSNVSASQLSSHVINIFTGPSNIESSPSRRSLASSNWNDYIGLDPLYYISLPFLSVKNLNLSYDVAVNGLVIPGSNETFPVCKSPVSSDTSSDFIDCGDCFPSFFNNYGVIFACFNDESLSTSASLRQALQYAVSFATTDVIVSQSSGKVSINMDVFALNIAHAKVVIGLLGGIILVFMFGSITFSFWDKFDLSYLEKDNSLSAWALLPLVPVSSSITLQNQKKPLKHHHTTIREAFSDLKLMSLYRFEDSNEQFDFLQTIVPQMLENLNWRSFVNLLMINHNYLTMFFKPSISYNRQLRWFHLFRYVVLVIFVTSVFFQVFYPNDGTCEEFKSILACSDRQHSVFQHSLCSWDESNDTCSMQLPKMTVMFVMLFAWLTTLVVLPLDTISSYIVDQYCFKRVDFTVYSSVGTAGKANEDDVLSEDNDPHQGVRFKGTATKAGEDEDDRSSKYDDDESIQPPPRSFFKSASRLFSFHRTPTEVLNRSDDIYSDSEADDEEGSPTNVYNRKYNNHDDEEEASIMIQSLASISFDGATMIKNLSAKEAPTVEDEASLVIASITLHFQQCGSIFPQLTRAEEVAWEEMKNARTQAISKNFGISSFAKHERKSLLDKLKGLFQRHQIQKKLKEARDKEAEIVETVMSLGKLASSEKILDQVLLNLFVVEQLPSLQKWILYRKLFCFDNYGDTKVDFVHWLGAWVGIISVLVFCLGWVFYWSLSNQTILMSLWGWNIGVVFLQDIFFVGIVRVALFYALAVQTATPCLRAIRRQFEAMTMFYRCGKQPLRKRMGDLTYSIFHYTSPVYRAVKHLDLQQELPQKQQFSLPHKVWINPSSTVRHVIANMDDLDILRCRANSTVSISVKSSSWISWMIACAPVLLFVGGETLADVSVDVLIPSLSSGFIILNAILFHLHPVLISIPYVFFLAIILWQFWLRQMAKRTVERLQQKHRQSQHDQYSPLQRQGSLLTKSTYQSMPTMSMYNISSSTSPMTVRKQLQTPSFFLHIYFIVKAVAKQLARLIVSLSPKRLYQIVFASHFLEKEKTQRWRMVCMPAPSSSSQVLVPIPPVMDDAMDDEDYEENGLSAIDRFDASFFAPASAARNIQNSNNSDVVCTLPDEIACLVGNSWHRKLAKRFQLRRPSDSSMGSGQIESSTSGSSSSVASSADEVLMARLNRDLFQTSSSQIEHFVLAMQRQQKKASTQGFVQDIALLAAKLAPPLKDTSKQLSLSTTTAHDPVKTLNLSTLSAMKNAEKVESKDNKSADEERIAFFMNEMSPTPTVLSKRAKRYEMLTLGCQNVDDILLYMVEEYVLYHFPDTKDHARLATKILSGELYLSVTSLVTIVEGIWSVYRPHNEYVPWEEQRRIRRSLHKWLKSETSAAARLRHHNPHYQQQLAHQQTSLITDNIANNEEAKELAQLTAEINTNTMMNHHVIMTSTAMQKLTAASSSSSASTWSQEGTIDASVAAATAAAHALSQQATVSFEKFNAWFRQALMEQDVLRQLTPYETLQGMGVASFFIGHGVERTPSGLLSPNDSSSVYGFNVDSSAAMAKPPSSISREYVQQIMGEYLKENRRQSLLARQPSTAAEMKSEVSSDLAPVAVSQNKSPAKHRSFFAKLMNNKKTDTTHVPQVSYAGSETRTVNFDGSHDTVPATYERFYDASAEVLQGQQHPTDHFLARPGAVSPRARRLSSFHSFVSPANATTAYHTQMSTGTQVQDISASVEEQLYDRIYEQLARTSSVSHMAISTNNNNSNLHTSSAVSPNNNNNSSNGGKTPRRNSSVFGATMKTIQSSGVSSSPSAGISDVGDLPVSPGSIPDNVVRASDIDQTTIQRDSAVDDWSMFANDSTFTYDATVAQTTPVTRVNSGSGGVRRMSHTLQGNSGKDSIPKQSSDEDVVESMQNPMLAWRNRQTKKLT